MPIAINHKICDKGRGCPCITVCETGAWSFSEEKKMPVVDNTKCTDCGVCIKTCPARAVLFAVNEEGLKQIQDAVSRDSRTADEVHEPRFNADPLDESLLVNEKSFDKALSKDVALVEFWSAQTCGRCRLNTPKYSDIVPDGLSVFQVNADKDKKLAERFGVHAFPALVLFRNGEVADRIFGFSSLADEKEMKRRISAVIA